jgi:hypothetical protein
VRRPGSNPDPVPKKIMWSRKFPSALFTFLIGETSCLLQFPSWLLQSPRSSVHLSPLLARVGPNEQCSSPVLATRSSQHSGKTDSYKWIWVKSQRQRLKRKKHKSGSWNLTWEIITH